jgi:uncharacterized NAD(P)/FAD-binding protein YdhS
MQAINLLRHDVPSVTLIERTRRLARGVAYSTGRSEHLLNVRHANMSAFPDDLEHFSAWLAKRHPEITGSFVPRAVYGDYLQNQLDAAAAAAADRLKIVHATAMALETTDGPLSISLSDGSAIAADRLVLALGNLPPHAPHGLDDEEFDPEIYVADPWQTNFSSGLSDRDEVLIVGSGLTMIDAVLALKADGFDGRITVMSRRGLLPHVHDERIDLPITRAERPVGTFSALVRKVRRESEAHGWRSVIDGLRPYTRDMWLAASPEDQSIFLRHLRPWWDIHRHRIAPEAAANIASLRAEGQLTIAAARTLGFRRVENGIEVKWRKRGERGVHHSSFRRVINCTGPQGDLLKTRDPLLIDLLAKGRIRPDVHRMGIDVTPQCEVIGQDGVIDQRILALGPMTRGAFWEVVAVPDIRMQTWNVARRIANAHWVGGEGL